MSHYPAIHTLLPHAGSMCLLDGIEQHDAHRIRCWASSHRLPDNPLRHHGMLSAQVGAEYAAQAVAVHGSLCREHTGKPRGGMIAVLSNVHWHVPRLDTLTDDLLIEASKTADLADGLAYRFVIHAGDRLVIEGELMIALQPEPA